MSEYKLWVNIPGKGQIIVKIVANSAYAAMEAAKAQGAPAPTVGS